MLHHHIPLYHHRDTSKNRALGMLACNIETFCFTNCIISQIYVEIYVLRQSGDTKGNNDMNNYRICYDSPYLNECLWHDSVNREFPHGFSFPVFPFAIPVFSFSGMSRLFLTSGTYLYASCLLVASQRSTSIFLLFCSYSYPHLRVR